MSGSDEAGPSNWPSAAISPAQCRAARALLGWSAADLAAKVGLEERFVRAFESDTGDPASGQIEALRSSLMRAGVIFTDGDSLGVRLGKRGGEEGTRLDELTTDNDR